MRAKPDGGRGAYLNYDALLDLRQEQDPVLSGSLEGVFFAPKNFGIIETTSLFKDVVGEGEFIHLDTAFTRDFLEKRRSLTIGDTVTAPSSFGGGRKFGGIRWGTDFSLDPTFVRAPRQSILGLAETPSVVEVYVNDLMRITSDVPAGPFEVRNVPGLSGDGTVQLVITDALGRQQIINQSFYFAPTNLRKGLKEYSFSAGLERLSYGAESFDYGDAFASATYRQGITDNLTMGGSLAFDEEVQVLGLSQALALTHVGSFSAAVGVSKSDAGTGYRYRASYDYISTDVGFGVGTEGTTVEYRQLGSAEHPPRLKQRFRAHASGTLGPLGRFALSYIHDENWVGENQSFATLSTSRKIKGASLQLSATQRIEPESFFALNLRLSVPLGNYRSMTTSASREESDWRFAAEYQKPFGNSEIGRSYRLRAEHMGNRQRYDGEIRLNGARFQSSAQVSHASETTSARVGLSGGIVAMDGGLFLSRRVDRSFAVVNAGGVEGISVKLENRDVGRTNSKGQLLVPRLLPFQKNQISIDPLDVPLDVEIGSEKFSATPHRRSGVVVELPIRRVLNATVWIMNANGEPVEAGSIVENEAGEVIGRTGNDGYSYLGGLTPGVHTYHSITATSACAFELDVPESLESLADMGEVTCH